MSESEEQVERQREVVAEPITPEYLEQRAAEGWELVALEWQRPAPHEESREPSLFEVPYGLSVAADGQHLIEVPQEMEAMRLMLNLIADDQSLREIAEALNREGLKTREGRDWTQVRLFDLLPRIVDAAPEIFKSESWPQIRALRPSRVTRSE